MHFHGMLCGIRPEDLTVPDLIEKYNRTTGVTELVPNTKKYIRWNYYSDKLGFFSCSRVSHYEKCAVYVSKYVTKDLIKLDLGRHMYFASTGLNRPELLFDADDVPKLFKESDFENDFVSMQRVNHTYGLMDNTETEYHIQENLSLGKTSRILSDYDILSKEEIKETDCLHKRMDYQQLKLY